MRWKPILRPGYFGRQRDKKVAEYNAKYGDGNWKLSWIVVDEFGTSTSYDFEEACKTWYEASYIDWFCRNPKELDFVCSYGECIDNDLSNISSGLDYSKQESWATHIQDIAVRNTLAKMGRKFEGPKDKILVIRSADTEGYKYGPGNIPFIKPGLICQPSLCPKWAQHGSTEEFWQSNKHLMVKE